MTSYLKESICSWCQFVIIHITSEGYMIDGLNGDGCYRETKKDYMQRALALIILCQKLDSKIPGFKANIPRTFELNDFKL